jgi:hypothetical protein
LEQDRGFEAATMAADSTGPKATTVVAASTDVRDTDRLLAPLWDVGQQEASAVETASADSAGHNAEAIFKVEVMDSGEVTLTAAVGSTVAEAPAAEVATAGDADNVL